ncbi:MAG: putative Oxidoreductase [Armatimonadetes bacterium]|jgi:predicted dehydrogenase|nr:putative Oxidoreductase [Armatimonadota bacterium]
MRKLRFGVIGAGGFAEVCHLPGLLTHPQAEVVALCGRRLDHARAMADRFGIPDVHTDYRELCARDDLDGITITTPNAVHAAQAHAAFGHGKHVFCEKPLGMDVAQVEAMLAAAERSGKVHQVAFTFRYTYCLQELRRRVRAGDLGQPYYVRLRFDSWRGLQPDWQIGWREKQDLSGGGILYDMGSHLFDCARFVLGPIETATGFTHHIPRQRVFARTGELTDVETDDLAAAWFRYESGVRGEWFMSRATPPHTENGYLEVVGTEGALQASLSRGNLERLRVSRPTAPDWAELPLPPEALDGQPHALGLMMRSFVDACLRGRLDGDVDASFHDGLAAQQGLAAVRQSQEIPCWMPLAQATG